MNEAIVADNTGSAPTLALALSGGGYRAALFHLGACRRLHELSLLEQVDAISSVSGGSLLSAFFADRMIAKGISKGLRIDDWESEVAEPFRAFVKNDLRPVPSIPHAFINALRPRGPIRHLGMRLRKTLTDRRLGELPKRPSFHFCATDLTFGVNWVFEAERIGSYEAGYTDAATDWPIARAVSASCAFPPIWGPMDVSGFDVDFTQGRQGVGYLELKRRILLCDGGLYDNLGLEPVQKKHSHILVSDGGWPFAFESPRGLRILPRYKDVAMAQVSKLRWRLLHAPSEIQDKTVAHWRLVGSERRESAAGYSADFARRVIGTIRTDLDPFSDAEIAVLENHGYFCADRGVEGVLDALVGEAPAIAPHPEWMDEARAERALEGRASRATKRSWPAALSDMLAMLRA